MSYNGRSVDSAMLAFISYLLFPLKAIINEYIIVLLDLILPAVISRLNTNPIGVFLLFLLSLR